VFFSGTGLGSDGAPRVVDSSSEAQPCGFQVVKDGGNLDVRVCE
jgi:hypothetical protein